MFPPTKINENWFQTNYSYLAKYTATTKFNNQRVPISTSVITGSKSFRLMILQGCMLLIMLPFFLLSTATPLERSAKLFFTQTPAVPVITSATAGETVVLTCEAGGSPAPEVYWLKNGEPLTQVKYKKKHIT